MADPQTERLPNGLTTVVIPVPGSHRVLLTLMVRAGSRDEAPAESGVAHVVEHMLFRGNARYPDADALNRAFEQAGAFEDAHTGVESTEIEMVAHPDRVEHALACLAELVHTPAFPEFEKERQIILDEIQYDYNEDGALTNLSSLASALLWPGHPLGQSVIGTRQSVERLTRETVARFHALRYRPERMVLGMAGAVTAERGFALLRRSLGGWNGAGPAADAPAAAAPPASQGPRLRLVADRDNQFGLQVSFPGPGYNAPEAVALAVLGRLLDDGPLSRIQRIVREERALVYGISAGYAAYRDAGQFDVATAVQPALLEPLLVTLMELLAGFRDQGPTADELELAKQRYRFDLEFSRDSLGAQIERHVWPLLYGHVLTEAEERARMEAVGVADLQQLARTLFSPQRLHLVLVGPVAGATERMIERAVARL
ncbi:MAG: insulinase family protein [Candidatus Lambdaproteobacteria bacterium]|nr:insulinase family protein [Candidatus Lambdaproteobacteria bacterium]